MVYSLRVPYEGFSSFLVYRSLGESDLEVIFRFDDQPADEPPHSYILPQEAFKRWLLMVRVEPGFVERFTDLAFNWSLLHYDLKTQHLSIPESQHHPVDGSVPFAPIPDAPEDGPKRDPYDPMWDYCDRPRVFGL